MKKKTLIIATVLVLSALVGVFVPTATAATPQPWMYAAIQPSKLGTVEAVEASFAIYHTQYAVAHGGCWTGDCYYAAVTEWLNAHGCSGCYVNKDGMSFKLKVDLPNYTPMDVIMPPTEPQPWMYGAVKDSGLLTVDRVQRSFFGAQIDYANLHGGCFDACYEAVATEWLNAHGCSNCYVKDFRLSYKVKIDTERNKPQ